MRPSYVRICELATEAYNHDQRAQRERRSGGGVFMVPKYFQRVSESPTNPQAKPPAKAFDVADLYRGPAAVADEGAAGTGQPLDEKLRQTYFWVVNHAVISPFYDVEYNEGANQSFTFGDT